MESWQRDVDATGPQVAGAMHVLDTRMLSLEHWRGGADAAGGGLAQVWRCFNYR